MSGSVSRAPSIAARQLSGVRSARSRIAGPSKRCASSVTSERVTVRTALAR